MLYKNPQKKQISETLEILSKKWGEQDHLEFSEFLSFFSMYMKSISNNGKENVTQNFLFFKETRGQLHLF